MTLRGRPSRCEAHGLQRRCPACLAGETATGNYPPLEVNPGTADWLLRAARYYDALTREANEPMTAAEFVLWTVGDMREPGQMRAHDAVRR